MWEHFTTKRAWVKKVLADAAEEKQEGIQGQWQQEKGNWDTNCDAQMMRRAYNDGKACNWESFKEECRGKRELSEWTFERLQEACDEVALEDIGRLSIAQDALRNSTDFLRRTYHQCLVWVGVTLSYVCPHCDRFPLEDYMWWVSSGHGDGNNRRKKQCSWCAASCGQYDWRAPDRTLVIQLGADANRAKVFKALAAPLGLCDNLVNVKHLANEDQDGDRPIQSIVTGLHEGSRRGIHVKKGQLSEAFPGAVVREGVGELTLEAEEVCTQRAFIDTKHIEPERWGPPSWMRTGTPSVMPFS